MLILGKMKNVWNIIVIVLVLYIYLLISDKRYDYPSRDQVILKCNINDSAFVISQVTLQSLVKIIYIASTGV